MQAANVRALRDFPEAADPDEVKRPYRLWDSKNKCQMRWRCYLNLRHAHMGALYEAAWSDGSTVIEVFDIRNGSLKGQYHREGSHIKFWRSTDKLEDA